MGFLGTDALAGVTLILPIFMLMTTMSNGGLGSGVASAIARAIGAGRQQDADALVFHSVVLAIIAGALFSGGILWGGPALYSALGGRGKSLAAALQYPTTCSPARIAVWIVNLFAAALRGSGNVKVPALITLVGAVLMIPASPALIFGFGPIPRLGIAGAGIAFAIYYLGALLVMVRYMRSGRSGLTLAVVPLQRRLFGDILKVGLPTAINALQTNLCVVLVTGAVGLFGTAALAGYGIAVRLDYVDDPDPVRPVLGRAHHGRHQHRRGQRRARPPHRLGLGPDRRRHHRRDRPCGCDRAVALADAVHARSRGAGARRHLSADRRLGLRPVRLRRFVISFAGQGAGRVLWPSVAVTARLIVAAGLGWIAVRSSTAAWRRSPPSSPCRS